MSYTPTQWKSGDVVTSEKLNKMEGGIAAGNLFVVTVDYAENSTEENLVYTSDKSAGEICEALAAGMLPIVMLGSNLNYDYGYSTYLYLDSCYEDEEDGYYESYAGFTGTCLSQGGNNEVVSANYALVQIQSGGDSKATAESQVAFFHGYNRFSQS